MTNYEILINDLPESIQDIAQTIGLEATLKLVRLCGGQSPYIPKMESCELKAKYRRIWSEYKDSKSGTIYTDLALKYNLSESHVRAIVREQQLSHSPKPVQYELF